MTQAIPGADVVLKRGNADSGTTAVRASRTTGTGNQKLRVFWRTPGTAGNGKTTEIIVSGTGTAFSINVTTSAVTITSATNGGGTATTTIAQARAALYADSVFQTNWDADFDDGDGTGVLAAASSSALAGGIAGETYTAVAEVKGVRGPGFTSGTADVTSFDSGGWREFISTLRDGGTLTFSINFNPSITSQMDFYADFEAGEAKNYELHFPDLYTTVLQFQATCTGFETTAELEQAVMANITLKVSGAPTWY